MRLARVRVPQGRHKNKEEGPSLFSSRNPISAEPKKEPVGEGDITSVIQQRMVSWIRIFEIAQ